MTRSISSVARLDQLIAEGTLTAIYARYGVEHRAP